MLYTTERVPVYNLSIPGSPTYYVGEHGVWVHNVACPINLDVYDSYRAASQATRGYKNVWEAHHLIPIWAVNKFRSLGKFVGKTDDMPAIILQGRNADMNVHGYIQTEVDDILKAMPNNASMAQIRNVLSEYYSGVPNASAAVRSALE